MSALEIECVYLFSRNPGELSAEDLLAVSQATSERAALVNHARKTLSSGTDPLKFVEDRMMGITGVRADVAYLTVAPLEERRSILVSCTVPKIDLRTSSHDSFYRRLFDQVVLKPWVEDETAPKQISAKMLQRLYLNEGLYCPDLQHIHQQLEPLRHAVTETFSDICQIEDIPLLDIAPGRLTYSIRYRPQS